MSKSEWVEINEFQSLKEYDAFIIWINRQIEQGICVELCDEENMPPPDEWHDRYFKHKKSGEVWKLLCPDPGYFPGAWLQAEN